jgi:hypothetical protein
LPHGRARILRCSSETTPQAKAGACQSNRAPRKRGPADRRQRRSSCQAGWLPPRRLRADPRSPCGWGCGRSFHIRETAVDPRKRPIAE